MVIVDIDWWTKKYGSPVSEEFICSLKKDCRVLKGHTIALGGGKNW